MRLPGAHTQKMWMSLQFRLQTRRLSSISTESVFAKLPWRKFNVSWWKTECDYVWIYGFVSDSAKKENVNTSTGSEK